ncbi:hypothetical protein AB1K62_07555 [Parasphingorhabdus sp. JC815]|uniref:hypothetical protein n=1 Tax=Parasphingorhabdus sp. JC815 TaxID=3232140 RepID=UPI00345A07CF
MRLIGLGLLTFLLAGFLIFLGQSGAFSTALNRAQGGGQQKFSDPHRVTVETLGISGKKVFAAAHNMKGPLILSGLPSYSGQRFHLPTDARPVSGRYDLSFSSRIAEGLEGVLRVTINGTKRADILLSDEDYPGADRKRKVSVELMSSELASGVLDIGLSLQGRGPIAKCTPDDAIAAVVEIDAESGLRLTLSKPVETAKDKLALWGGHVPLVWRPGQSVTEKTLSVIYAARLAQKGYSPYFTQKGITGDQLAKLVDEATLYTDLTIPEAYPVPLTGDSANRGARKFDRQTTWRYRYASDSLPENLLPSVLDMRMALGPIEGDSQYNLLVTLNEHMLFAERVSPQAERFSQSIELPAGLQRSLNNLEITLVDAYRDELRCGSTSQSIAELLPETVLRSGSHSVNDGLSELKALLLSSGDISFSASTTTTVDANAATGLLAALAPQRLTFINKNGPVSMRLVTGDIAKQSKANDWIVYLSKEPNEGYVAIRGKDKRDLSGIAIALVISVPNKPHQPKAGIAQ